MAKRAASTRLEAEVMKRLERIAKVDRRTVANVIEICVEEYLPELEAELRTKKGISLSRPEDDTTRQPELAMVLNESADAPAPPQKSAGKTTYKKPRGIKKSSEN